MTIDNHPPVEREYIEIYPVAWEPVTDVDLSSIMRTRSSETSSEITLYFHIAFCPEICSFCSFNKTSFKPQLYKRYVEALDREIQSYRNHPDIAGRMVTAVYIGGGTGSMLTPPELSRLLDSVRDIFDVSPECEISVECHPNTLSPEKIHGYHGLGVNRLSIGAQSFVDTKLKSIGRSNSAEQNRLMVSAAQSAGIRTVSLDIMYRLPMQTIEDLDKELEEISNLRPDNVSFYSFIVEGTNFERALPTLPDARLETQMAERIFDRLIANGYSRWSVADYSIPDRTTKYSLNYWNAPQTLLLGFGAGAHTHYFGGHVWSNTYIVNDYVDAIEQGRFPAVAGQPVSTRELMHRYMVLGVHCMQVSLEPFHRIFGVRAQDYFARDLEVLSGYGWIELDGDTMRLTQAGLFYMNNIAKQFFSPHSNGNVQPWSMALKRIRRDRYPSLSA